MEQYTYFILVKFGKDLNKLSHFDICFLLEKYNPGGVLPEGVR